LAIIDIDQLLLATEEIGEESIPFHLDTFDIDELLDKTDNWEKSIPSKRRINMTTKENRYQDLPEEWIELVKKAMKSNITKEEFKKFLEEKLRVNKD